MSKLLQGDDLEKRAKELGVDTEGPALTHRYDGSRCRADAELQRRVIEAERSIREAKYWKIAVISAVASVVSAATALVSAITAIIAVAK